MEKTSASIATELTAYLRDAIKEAIAIIASHNISELPEEVIPICWMAPTEPGNHEGREESITKREFFRLPSDIIREIYANPAVERAVSKAHEFVSEHVTRGGKPYPFMPDARDIARTVLGAYFNKSEGISLVADDIHSVVAEFVSDLSAPRWLAIFKCGWFSADEKVTLAEGITLRPVARHDIETYGRGSLERFPKPWIAEDDWILEIETPEMQQLHEIARDVVNALSLTKTGRCNSTLLYDGPKSQFLRYASGRGGFPISTSRIGSPMEKLNKPKYDGLPRCFIA